MILGVNELNAEEKETCGLQHYPRTFLSLERVRRETWGWRRVSELSYCHLLCHLGQLLLGVVSG